MSDFTVFDVAFPPEAAIPATCTFSPCIKGRAGLYLDLKAKGGRKSAEDLEFRPLQLPKCR